VITEKAESSAPTAMTNEITRQRQSSASGLFFDLRIVGRNRHGSHSKKQKDYIIVVIILASKKSTYLRMNTIPQVVLLEALPAAPFV
jgi:hypothetical protein